MTPMHNYFLDLLLVSWCWVPASCCKHASADQTHKEIKSLEWLVEAEVMLQTADQEHTCYTFNAGYVTTVKHHYQGFAESDVVSSLPSRDYGVVYEGYGLVASELLQTA